MAKIQTALFKFGAIFVALLIIFPQLILSWSTPVFIPYTDKTFKGSSHRFEVANDTSNCVSSLPPSLDAQISSINTGGGCVSLYLEQNCTGEFAMLKPGNPIHDDLSYWQGFNDAVRSIGSCLDRCHETIRKSDRNHSFVSFYDKTNYAGQHVTLQMESNSCIQLPTGMENRISSLKMFGNFCIELHHNWDCTGEFMDIRSRAPILHNLKFWGNIDDKTSAVSMCGYNCSGDHIMQNLTAEIDKPIGNGVILYDGENQEGNQIFLNLTQGCVNLPETWAGKAVSVQVAENLCVKAFRDFHCPSEGLSLEVKNRTWTTIPSMELKAFKISIFSLELCFQSALMTAETMTQEADRRWSFLEILGISFGVIFGICLISGLIIGGIMMSRRIHGDNSSRMFSRFSDSVRELSL